MSVAPSLGLYWTLYELGCSERETTKQMLKVL